ncbi:hypothetical protein [Arcanobacterium buesumense]|uniref:Uncharacterized protein n=1 Tax=Arcanobacterium buesumense TaxID=2722751 RepID=A0A6H2ELS5_9ACTO|nr:hypothetical protein [Arcanobacterium buesumense]QJC22019.1 hypothetical protein HC352_05560 [Arcanobacterium buesumense]
MTPHEQTTAWEKAIAEHDWNTARQLSDTAAQIAYICTLEAGDAIIRTHHTIQALELEKEHWENAYYDLAEHINASFPRRQRTQIPHTRRTKNPDTYTEDLHKALVSIQRELQRQPCGIAGVRITSKGSEFMTREEAYQAMKQEYRFSEA